MDARSNEPDAALNALQDLEDQIRQMSAGDDQLASALAAIAGALAQDQSTQQLANAINTGDLRQISQATHDLAQQVDQMNNQDKQRVAKVLRDASGKAQRSSISVANELASAAAALDSSSGGDSSDQSANSPYGQESDSNGQYNQSARDALNQLSDSAAAAGERQRTSSQLQSSRNALERALGRTQSRSDSSSSSNGRSSSSSSSSGQRSQSSSGTGSADQNQGGGSQGQTGDTGADSQGGGGQSPGDEGSNGQTGNGSGYSTGGQGEPHTGGSENLDVITRPEQVPSNGSVPPDESSLNPYLADAGQSSANASEEAVQPSYSRKATQGNDSGSIPLGLRDLVKDYFSSLDKNQR